MLTKTQTKLLEAFSFQQLKKYTFLPLSKSSTCLDVLMCNAKDIGALECIKRVYKDIKLNIKVCSQEEFLQNLQLYEQQLKIITLLKAFQKEQDHQGSPVIVTLLHEILKEACFKKASDVHIEAMHESCLIRFRLDGFLHPMFEFEAKLFAPLSSCVKQHANMDIAKKLQPQDGRFSLLLQEQTYDFRVSSLPIIEGESLVIRILYKDDSLFCIKNLQLQALKEQEFKNLLQKPYGLFLVTGPTGSGKSTTLYAALNFLKNVHEKIITIEDPIEYHMQGIAQVQVNEKINLHFNTLLPSILRQDPDKIMIGEIRDTHTLSIAIQAALTGHLVLSTLHTNNALATLERLKDMGAQSYLIASTLLGVVAQRLVRRLCSCKERLDLTQTQKEFIPKEYHNKDFYMPKGCLKCSHTGYLGRVLLSEILSIDTSLENLIQSHASKTTFVQTLNKKRFHSLAQDGFYKASLGETSLDEVLRVNLL